MRWPSPTREVLYPETTLQVQPDYTHFDMLSPPDSYQIAENSGVFTSGSLEQLGSDYEPFLEFPLKKYPRVCVHWEPLHQLYDQTNLFDYVAAQ